jgi:hypothetical protein
MWRWTGVHGGGTHGPSSAAAQFDAGEDVEECHTRFVTILLIHFVTWIKGGTVNRYTDASVDTSCLTEVRPEASMTPGCSRHTCAKE